MIMSCSGCVNVVVDNWQKDGPCEYSNSVVGQSMAVTLWMTVLT